MIRAYRCVLVGSLVFAAGCGAANDTPETPEGGASGTDGVNLVGSYQLVSRELPDGSRLEPPEVFGFLTYTDVHRHFHIYGPGADGAPFSTSFVASYSISGDEYSETTHFETVNNRPEGSGLVYDIPGPTFTTELMRDDESIRFRDGQDGPMLEFTEDGLVATLDGEFVDRWTRVR